MWHTIGSEVTKPPPDEVTRGSDAYIPSQPFLTALVHIFPHLFLHIKHRCAKMRLNCLVNVVKMYWCFFKMRAKNVNVTGLSIAWVSLHLTFVVLWWVTLQDWPRCSWAVCRCRCMEILHHSSYRPSQRWLSHLSRKVYCKHWWWWKRRWVRVNVATNLQCVFTIKDLY